MRHLLCILIAISLQADGIGSYLTRDWILHIDTESGLHTVTFAGIQFPASNDLSYSHCREAFTDLVIARPVKVDRNAVYADGVNVIEHLRKKGCIKQ